MTYTSNVPQGTQQISTTQPIILDNFGFISTGVGVEHNFDVNGNGSNMYHRKASMPNLALSPALPGGTNGIYFVNSGKSFFYDGTTNWQLNTWATQSSSSFTPTSISTYDNVVAVPANSAGEIYFYSSAAKLVTTGSFVSDGTKVYAYSNLLKEEGSGTFYAIELNNNPGALTITARSGDSDATGQVFKYLITYRLLSTL